ncbi:hypothetical protein BCR41DRAFT_94981 [Lobosporangium transversale]|uniref:Uncharacterized protein n=1 Tax=Lobosporangium transversale TaxID=64571 RepID=A0A1Y2GKF0_9FUNG|nr:hypothetical protein BCR41DRAFT_94981 [Lobosporangium transversale]ORZ13395.1 hypothetical protein BCR41DRAFT_94981 [Lobosporangium transversale]|eukprot:XP_021880476.1 hypothetical protein BCR41DRAFT_94981 [Lobosporangium transversale]
MDFMCSFFFLFQGYKLLLISTLSCVVVFTQPDEIASFVSSSFVNAYVLSLLCPQFSSSSTCKVGNFESNNHNKNKCITVIPTHLNTSLTTFFFFIFFIFIFYATSINTIQLCQHQPNCHLSSTFCHSLPADFSLYFFFYCLLGCTSRRYTLHLATDKVIALH